MHTWPGRKIKARKRTAAATATENTGVRCGKWVLRSTKSRICRGQHFTPSTPARIAPKQKRKLTSSPTSSQNSCTPSNPNPMEEEDFDDLRKWPHDHTKEFLLAMLEEQKRNLGPNCTRKPTIFEEHGWNRIEKDVALRTKTSRYTKRRLKGKQKRLKFWFNRYRDLLKTTGFGWDEDLGTVTAPDEVWNEYIQTHPWAARFQHQGLPHYELLCELYRGSVATGELNRASSRGGLESDEEHDMQMSMSQGQAGASSGSRKRRSQESDSRDAERAKKAEFFERMGKYFEVRTEQQRGAAEGQQSDADPYGIPAAMFLLNQYKGCITDETYFKANHMFMISPDMRQSWLCTDEDYRLGWLMRLP